MVEYKRNEDKILEAIQQYIDTTYTAHYARGSGRDVVDDWEEMGIAKEQARAVLPEGLMQSRLYVNGTLRSWIHYIELREKNGTQKEHVEIARACADAITKIFPMGESYLAPPKK